MDTQNEDARLDALHQLRLLDTPASECFDRITRMASQIFGLPIAAVSLTDRDRQWFKSRVGVQHDSIAREKAPCAQVAETTEPLVLTDLLDDPCYATSRLAADGVRFYAGAPLVTREGYGLGSLCVLGTEPRSATTNEMALLRDLAAMVMSQIELQHAYGRIDPVSGMPNRNQFLDDLEDLAREHHGERRMIVLVDLARHDQINAITRAMGAARVEDMVKEAARSLRTVLGPERVGYHVASTQFAFLSPPDVEERQYLGLLIAGFATVRAGSTVRFVTTVALGVMPVVLGETPPSDMLRGAHNAAQDARELDGAISIYSPSADRDHRRQLELLNDFGSALESTSQLRLAFQPRVELATGDCVGAEALLRWRHPILGDISPAEFIPIIESTALMRATTDWVMQAAMSQQSQWQATGLRMPLSINVSAANLDEDDFIQRLQLYGLKHRIEPAMVEIELTEGAIMAHADHARACLQTMSELGFRIAIDDFGTGYSSLAYLQTLPAHVLKIDQSFVRDMMIDSREHILVATMIRLSHQLSYRVVAEGVETQEAADLLLQLGCEEAQGYLFGRPMEAAELAEWMTSRSAEQQIKSAAA